MAEYKLKNGYVLTDEEIERRAAEWESDDAEIGLVPLRVGRPPLSGEPNANLSFKCPESGAELIARAAEVAGVKKSAFIRLFSNSYVKGKRRVKVVPSCAVLATAMVPLWAWAMSRAMARPSP